MSSDTSLNSPFLDSVQRVEVIVDMLQTRFAKAGNAIHQFAGKVVALIVVQPFFEHGVIVEAAHGYRSRALHLLDKLFLELCGTHGTAQSPQVLVDKRGDSQLEVCLCVFENFAKTLRGYVCASVATLLRCPMFASVV